MPKVKIPQFSERHNSERRAEIAKVPFKYKITSYWGEDQAYFRFKRNKLLEKDDKIEKDEKLPNINHSVVESYTNDADIL